VDSSMVSCAAVSFSQPRGRLIISSPV